MSVRIYTVIDTGEVVFACEDFFSYFYDIPATEIFSLGVFSVDTEISPLGLIGNYKYVNEELIQCDAFTNELTAKLNKAGKYFGITVSLDTKFLPLQDEIYAYKYQEALGYLAAETPVETDYPFLKGIAVAKDVTLLDAAKIVKFMHDDFEASKSRLMEKVE